MTDSMIWIQDIRNNTTFLLSTGDTLTVSQTGALMWQGTSSIGPAAGATATYITVAGQVSIRNFQVADQSTMTVTQSGSVSLMSSFALLMGTFNGGGGSVLSNAGSIFGQGVNALGGGNTILNSGLIDGAATGVHLGVNAVQSDVLTNSGTISGHGNAGVIMNATGETVTNTGSIFSNKGNGIEVLGNVRVAAGFIESGAVVQRINNSGVIAAPSGIGIDVQLTLATGLVILNNSGTISGAYNSYYGSSGVDQIINSGTMTGQVNLREGNDLFDCTDGKVTGGIYLGAGADTFKGMNATIEGGITDNGGSDIYYTDDSDLIIAENGFDLDVVYAATSYRLWAGIENLTLLTGDDYDGFGNTENNRINGNTGDNRLEGLSGNDTLNGDLGDDVMQGNTGNDALFGDDGNDDMQGGAGLDALNGGGGDDVLRGNSGNDTLRGDDGDDTVNGGTGRDNMAGGGDADVFLFTALSHSGATQATADVITDFSQGDDIIDLSALDAVRNTLATNDSFTFIGTAAFSPSTPGQLRYVQVGGNTYVEAEVTGNAIADFVIRLNGLYTLTSADFAM